jgi:1-acyl-sn-glycerol-3-phosphate acyltransferase
MPPFHWWRTVFVLIPVIGFGTIVLGTMSLVAGLFDRSGNAAHRCAQWWARFILFTSGVRIDRRGAPLPPEGESCLFVANHASFYDVPIMFTAVPRQLRIMAKATLGYIPFIGWHLHRSGHVLVDRRSPGAAIFKRMQRMARSGASLIVFPEAARTDDGRLMKFKAGIFLLAIEHGLPIVPISVAGSRQVMPKGRLMVHPATVVVTVHEPISTVGMNREDARPLAERVRGIVGSAVPGGLDGEPGAS